MNAAPKPLSAMDLIDDIHIHHDVALTLGLQALSSENLLSAFSEDSPHRYMSDPISTSIGFTCPLLSPSCSTELCRVKYVPFGMI
jgi:hypothetical protein